MNVGIIGSGPNMNRHISALKNIKEARLAGCYFSETRQTHGAESNHCPCYDDPDRLLDDVDAIIIADTSSVNSRMVIKALKKAKHVFLYPLMLRSANEALQFIKLAHEANAVLKVGSIGCVNLQGLLNIIPDVSGIKFIELHYYKSITKIPPVNPIFEALLISSQIINGLVKSQILSIKAKGLMMVSKKPEIINTRLDYDNGCAVNITCNVVAARDDFQGTIVLKNSCIKYDFISHKLTSWNIQRTNNTDGSPLFVDQIKIANNDVVFKELSDFFQSASSGSKHHVTHDCGFEPFILTERILEKVRKSVIQYT